MRNLVNKLDRLKQTEDVLERNSLAIELAESGDPAVKSALIALIDRPELSDYRGTLINSLGRFDCSDKFLWLVNLVCKGNWEVAHEAFDLLTNIESADSSEVILGFNRLAKNLEFDLIEDWRKELIEELLAMFD